MLSALDAGGHHEAMSDRFGDFVTAHGPPSYVCCTFGPVVGDAIFLAGERPQVAGLGLKKWAARRRLKVTQLTFARVDPSIPSGSSASWSGPFGAMLSRSSGW